MELSEIKNKVAQIREHVEAIRAATYKVVEVNHEGVVYYVIADYDIDSDQYSFTVTNDSFVEIKLLCEVPPAIIIELAQLIRYVGDFETTPDSPKSLTVEEVADRAHTLMTKDHDVSEFELK